MNFQSLLEIASEKEKEVSSQPKQKFGFTTKLSAPKKLEKKIVVKKKKNDDGPAVDNSAVASFLRKKKEEARDKEYEEKEKKVELLRLRAEAKHSTKAHAMATRTKDNLKVYSGNSASKDGESSKVQEKKHKEFMKKVQKASQIVEENRRRKEEKKCVTIQVKKANPVIKSKAPGGPMSFEDILKMAAKNKDGRHPIKHPSPEYSDDSSEGDDDDDELIQKKKEDAERQKRRQRDEKFYKQTPLAGHRRKLANYSSRETCDVKPSSSAQNFDRVNMKNAEKHLSASKEELKLSSTDRAKLISSQFNGHKQVQVNNNASHHSHSSQVKGKNISHDRQAKNKAVGDRQTKNKASSDGVKSKQKLPPGKTSKETNHSVIVCKSSDKSRPPDREMTRKSAMVQSSGVSPWDRIYGEIQRNQPKKAVKRHQVIDSDSDEYDSEMDDFIDDGEGEEEDYSSAIKNIFGYDKSKYKYEREDLRDMDASFCQTMKEEARSARLGREEDLEDIRRERAELMKNAKKKRR